ncbi:hypothetical protein Salat_2407700 [Sesamum alatum]|uniref:Uncharacterized protein n=1 Tax=Sesamum alatum TaxID=300844 RepID=A0AAE1XXI9_9LAMI|nr:hypothetical protein Salat_2407700 [Sesamum alatum]
MEWTFIDALVDHKNNGHFHRDGVNFRVVSCSIHDVNKQHGTQHSCSLQQGGSLCGSGRCDLGKDHQGWVDDAPSPPMENLVEANIHELDDGPVDSTSLWWFLEEYYASNDDEVESILALPGIPHTIKRPPCAPPPSPNSNYVSTENASSSSSDDINMSK